MQAGSAKNDRDTGVFAIKKEWLLAAGLVLATLAGALLLMRSFAPTLLGIPADLQLVAASKSVPPFFENVFRQSDAESDTLILQDPYTSIRFRPLLPGNDEVGPHDILGFRNTAIPADADVIAIGDSQTYGLGEPVASSWPALLEQHPATDIDIYSMATGGWGAVQYYDMFSKALRLRPATVIVAFYSGNDALESFLTSYGNSHWHWLRPDPGLDKSDAPRVGNMMDMDNVWPVEFADGTRMKFTPGSRLPANNSDNAAVRAGYRIMADVARHMGTMGDENAVKVVFTIIPTRELVYASRLREEAIVAPDDYRQLVRMEQQNIDELSAAIEHVPGAHYVDVVKPLQRAALTDNLYPRQWDGHPGERGYRVIAGAIATALARPD